MRDGTHSRLQPNKPKRALSRWEIALVNKNLIPSDGALGFWLELKWMGYDISVDEKIGRWREANTPRGEPVELDFERTIEDIAKIILPSQKTPIPAATMLGQMDLDFLEPVLLKNYKKKPHYPPVSIFRGIMLQKKKELSWRGLPRYFYAYQDEARQLGFVNEDGRIEIPSYEKFRTFVHLCVNWDEIRDAIVMELRPIAEEHGIVFGSQSTEDATMVETVENDPDGKYNGHYKKTGLKEDIITCRATGLPIINETIGGTDCEGHTLIGQLEHLQELGIHVEDHWVDGTYATLENIAVAQTMFGTTLHYQVQEGWVIREDGMPEYIKKLYQQFWEDTDFKPGASLNEMMAFLTRRGKNVVEQGRSLQQTALSEGAWGKEKRCKRGRPSTVERSAQDRFFESERVINEGMRLLEPVGAYYRNIVMERAQKNPEAMKKDKGKRQLAESINNHLKNDFGLQKGLRVKGRKKVHTHVSMGCVFLLLVGMHKMRHGVTTNLASLIGIE